MQESIKKLVNFAAVIICTAILFSFYPGSAFAQPTANAGPDQEDVGFGTPVQLSGTGSTGAAPLTYKWEQYLGLRATLSDPTSANPTFTTPTYSDMILEHEQENFGIVGIQPNFLESIWYLTVSDATGASSTDTVTISYAEYFRTSGLSNVAVGTPAYLHGPASQETFNWTLRGPFFSQSILMNGTTRFPNFMPDGTGDYTVTETTTGTSIAIHAATWSGVRQCAACHAGQLVEDKVTPWSHTGHATFFSEAIDGIKSSHYGESCIKCHTLGYDTSLEADNEGFDDIADGFWTFPSPLQEGNWDDMVNNLPELANVANIQCENCHGPGDDHFGEHETIAKTYDDAVCGFCHNEGTHHVRPDQIRNSGHSNIARSGSASCERCHVGQGFVEQQIRQVAEYVVAENPQPITCQTCHDPHEHTYEHQLRAYGSAELPTGEMVENIGTGGICVMCHNSRRVATEVLVDKVRAPHYGTQGDMMAGTNAMEIPGVTYPDSFHAGDDFVAYYFSDEGDDHNNLCVTCHMAGNSDTANSHITGDHSFNISMEVNGEKVENLDACNICHVNLTSFDRRARGDYDGDGTVEGVQTEVEGLLEVVHSAILSSLAGGSFEESHGGFEFHDADGNVIEPTEAQYIAAYNWAYVHNDGSHGIHNTAYAVKLLQSAYQNLTGQAIPGGTIRLDMEPPLNIKRRVKADS